MKVHELIKEKSMTITAQRRENMKDYNQMIETIRRQMPYGVGADYTGGIEMTAICFLAQEAETVIEALHEKAQRENPRRLTLEELQRMNDERVCVKFPDIEIPALVAYADASSEEYNPADGAAVWLTNNRGGRSTYEEIIADGGHIFGTPPRK